MKRKWALALAGAALGLAVYAGSVLATPAPVRAGGPREIPRKERISGSPG